MTPLVLPLTELQRDVWMVSHRSPEASSAHNLSGLVKFCGRFQPRALRAAAEALVQRHAGLRASILGDGSGQRVHEAAKFDIPLTQFLTTGDKGREDFVSLAYEEGRRRFDPVTEPLFRFHVARLAEQEHVLVFTTAGIVASISKGRLFREFCEAYAMMSTGQDWKPTPVIPYETYVCSRTDGYSSSIREEDQDYWRSKITEKALSFHMLADVEPTQRMYDGGCVRRSLAANIVSSLRSVCARYHISLFQFLLSALAVLLYGVSRQEVIPVGVGVTRSHGDSRWPPEDSILPFCVECAHVASISELLKHVRDVVLDAYEHRNVYLRPLMGGRDPYSPAAEASPLSIVFNLDSPMTVSAGDSLSMEVLDNFCGTTRFDLLLNVIERQSWCAVELRYNSGIFYRETIERWMDMLQSILAQMITDTEVPLNRLLAVQ